METIDKEERSLDQSRPLALHIRDRRQWYGKNGLTQEQLARLAGITPALLGSYEGRRELPESLCVSAQFEQRDAPEVMEVTEPASGERGFTPQPLQGLRPLF